MNFALRLKELRQEKGLLQKEVAGKIGVSTQSYNYYENWVNKPDPETLIKLADLFEVSIDYLLGRGDDLGGILLPRSASAFTADEEELLRNYRSMTQAQQIRFIAYGEGLISTGDSVKKRS